ncbi:type II restriction endonuclease [Vibrio rotiferianus]|nr:type II restriction endonuclease [Vibrio rotiferianus]PIB17785.1 Type II site-specific deoxyribonuclease [Vibrio rotiferianus CAIM 577 = LMG 21460]
MITFNEENPDNALMQRREAEYSLFRRVEEIHVLDLIKTGFSSVDEFISLANSVSNRRKSRSGKSLELHLEHIFLENSLSSFDTQAVTENNKKPDFLFPSGESYHDANYPVEKLRMLAVKTTCKDRWRQVLNEADRIQMVYLFTLQEGVSKNQFKEMTDSNVKLVVPLSLHKSFHKDFRDELISLESFIESTKEVYID